MSEKKPLSVLLILLNLAAVCCLVYLAVPYLAHDTTVNNPDAMLPMERWDGSGMALTFGLLPMIAANICGYLFALKKEKKLLRLLFLLPGIAELVFTAHYWIISLLFYN